MPLIHTSSAVSEVKKGGTVSDAAFEATREAIKDDNLFEKVSSKSIQNQSASEAYLLTQSHSGTVEEGDEVSAYISKSYSCDILGSESGLCNVKVDILAKKDTK